MKKNIADSKNILLALSLLNTKIMPRDHEEELEPR